jgi:chemotaxis protein MotB
MDRTFTPWRRADRFADSGRRSRTRAVPEWFITWGDLMSLLLCFFVLLQVFSEVKKDEEYVKVVGGIQEAFGFTGGIERSRIDGEDFGAIIELFGGTAARGDGEARDEIVQARRNGEGLHFIVGGPRGFAQESAEITPEMREGLRRVAQAVAGRRTRIVVRGHAANKFLSSGSPWRDLNELSYARARAVLDVLIEAGVEEGHCRIEAAGRWMPVTDSPDPTGALNRRVEIIITEEIVDADRP